MCIYIYIYIYMYIYTHTHTHTHTHMFVCMCMHVFVYIRVYGYLNVYMCVCMYVMKSKDSFHIFVQSVVMLILSLFPHGLWLNLEVYIICLEEVGLPRINRMAARRPYAWQKDWVMSHGQENPVLAVIKIWDHITSNIWWLNSLDWNPLDYVWGVVE